MDSAIGSASRNSTPSLGNSPPPAEDVGAHEEEPEAGGMMPVCGPIGDGIGLRSKMVRIGECATAIWLNVSSGGSWLDISVAYMGTPDE